MNAATETSESFAAPATAPRPVRPFYWSVRRELWENRSLFIAPAVAGVIVLLTGFSLFSGAVWARTVGVIMATVSAIANFAWIPHYPFWALTIIAIDVFVIWALTVHGRDVVADR